MKTIAFFLLVGGLMMLFGIKLSDFEVQRTRKLRQQVKRAKARPRNDIITKTIREVRQILAVQNLQGGMVAVWGSSAGLALCGVALGQTLDNSYAIPVLIAIFATVPFLFVKMRWAEKEKQMNESLETALNSVTTSYLRGNNTILAAVQENLDHLKPPVSQVFRLFVVQATLIDSDTTAALLRMKDTVHNAIFAQWVDGVIQCQNDHNLKVTLPRILEKFSDVRTVTGETEIIMAEPKRTYFIMLVSAIASPVLLFFLNRDWWSILVHTPLGKVLMAMHIAAIAIALFMGFSAMQPMDMKGGDRK